MKFISSAAEKLVLLLFTAFIVFNISAFVKDKAIIDSFSGDNPEGSFTLFVILVVFAAILLFFAGRSLLTNKITDQRINMINTESSGKGTLLLIAIITILPRLAWLYLIHVVPINDYMEYYTLASELSAGSIVHNGYIAMFPHIIGYPLILSLIYKLFGARIIIAQLLNVLLHVGISATLYFIGKKLFNRRMGATAAILWSIWPSQIFYVSLISTEALFTLLNLLTILLFLKIISDRQELAVSAAQFIILGVLCAFANAVRPIGLLLLAAIALFHFLLRVEGPRLLEGAFKKISLFMLFAVGYMVTFLMINTNISQAIGQEAAKSPVGFNFYVGSNLDYRGVWNPDDASVLTKLEEDTGKKAQDIHNVLFQYGVERYRTQSHANVELLLDKHKMLWLIDSDILWYIRTALDVTKPPLFDFIRWYETLSITCNFYYYVIMLLCLFGSVMLLVRSPKKGLLLPIILILGMACVHLIVEVSGRYHFPALALFSLIAAYGLCWQGVRPLAKNC